MLRLALLNGRGRLGTYIGALVALIAASVLTTAWGMQLESVLRGHPPVERYAGAAAVVTGQQIVGSDHDVPLIQRGPGRAVGPPPRAAAGARSRELWAHLTAGGRARRSGGDRRRVGAGPAGRAGSRRPRMGKRAADAV